jgi:EpsI family protein
VFSDGVFLQTPTGNFQVAEACAGLRFLIATVALALLFAYLAYHQWWRRIAFMILALIIPVIANGFRAFGIVLLAYLTDNQVAVDVDHIVYGWIFLTLVTVALLGAGMLLRGKSEPPAIALPLYDGRPSRARPIFLVGLVAALVGLGTPVLAAALRNDAVPSSVAGPAAPTVAAPWTLIEAADTGWTPAFPNAPWTRKLTYGDGQRTVDLFVAYYPWQNQGAEVVNPSNRIAPDDDWKRIGDRSATIVVDGAQLAVMATRIGRDGRQRMVLQWYWVAGEMTGGAVRAKLLELWGLVSGQTPAAAIVVATDEDIEGHAAETLASFLASMSGLGATLEAAGS